jgi:hypothetical protein
VSKRSVAVYKEILDVRFCNARVVPVFVGQLSPIATRSEVSGIFWLGGISLTRYHPLYHFRRKAMDIDDVLAMKWAGGKSSAKFTMLIVGCG